MVAESKSFPSSPLPPLAPAVSRPGLKYKLISEIVRAQIKALYVVHGMTPSQIAPAVGISVQQVRNLCSREKWAALKVSKEGARQSKISDQILARAEADIKRIVETTAVLAEDLSLRSLKLSGEYLEAGDAKSLQMASGAARNFVQIARLSRGLDRSAGGSGGGSAGDGAPSLAVFMVRGEPVERLLEQAQVVNVEAREAKAIAAPAAGT